MHEIICPHCNKAFKIDEAGYANILKQVRDGDFDKQLHERLELAEREKRDAIALAEAKLANALQGAAARKDAEIQALQAQLAAAEVARKLAVTEALGAVSKERDGLANELVRAGLRQLQKHKTRLATLRAALEDGERSGASTSFDVDAFLKTKRQKIAGSTGKTAAAM